MEEEERFPFSILSRLKPTNSQRPVRPMYNAIIVAK